MQVERDPYKALGVDRRSRPEAIKTAYRKLALKYHPDRNPGNQKAEEIFMQCAEAYAVLRDPQARKQYDREVARRSQTPRRRPRPRKTGSRTPRRRAPDQPIEVPIDVDLGDPDDVKQAFNDIFDQLFGQRPSKKKKSREMNPKEFLHEAARFGVEFVIEELFGVYDDE